MLKKKNGVDASPPLGFSLFRLAHCLLVLHAGVTIIIGLGHAGNGAIWASLDRPFALTLGILMALASGCALFAITARALFPPAIFFCTFHAVALVALPVMTPVIFPMHILSFLLAGIYGLTTVLLMRLYFAQPVPKRK